MNLQDILQRVRSGDVVPPSELLPLLMLEHREERCRVNTGLARVYAETGNFEQAKVFISRAWMLSNCSPDVLPLYVDIHAALKDVESIRSAYKLLGMRAAAQGDVTQALDHFNRWQYAYAHHLGLDKYEFDFDVLESVDKLAEPMRFRQYYHARRGHDEKTRIAYLVYGMTHINSVLVKINRMFARYHDKDRFEVAFFVPDRRSRTLRQAQTQQTISFFREHNCSVTLAPHSMNRLERLKSVARQIHDYRPDVLITSALLADMEHYFIAALRPAPLTVGLIQGPPPQFSAPSLDWAISWSKHPLLDSPCDVSMHKLGIDLPERSAAPVCTKKDIDISEDCLVMMSVGRHVKFQDRGFWSAIATVLHAIDNLCYVIVGAQREQVSLLDGLLTPELKNRVRFLGWREDCLDIMHLADIVVDTYPSGGGHVLVDAMALGIPFISFANNYMRRYDQTDWSVADEFVDIPELIVPRGDFAVFIEVIKKLASDEGHRKKMGRVCRESIAANMKNPENSVRDMEHIIVEIIRRKQRKKIKFNSGTPSFITWLTKRR